MLTLIAVIYEDEEIRQKQLLASMVLEELKEQLFKHTKNIIAGNIRKLTYREQRIDNGDTRHFLIATRLDMKDSFKPNARLPHNVILTPSSGQHAI